MKLITLKKQLKPTSGQVLIEGERIEAASKRIKKNIGVVRTTGGMQASIKVNYKKLARMQDLRENITLLPGDIVVVR